MTDIVDQPLGPPRELRFRRKLSFRVYVSELLGAKGLLRALSEREIRVRYKQAYLGIAWSLLSPTVLMVVFTVLSAHSIINISTHGKPAYLFAYAGLIPWTFFTNAVSQGGMSLVSNLYLVNKIYCPREVFPLSYIIVSCIDGLISSLLLIVLFAIGHTLPSETIYWLPILFVFELIFTIAVVVTTSILVVYMRDLRHLIPIVIQFGLFATPVMYSITTLSPSIRGVYSILNPLGPIIDSMRQALLFNQGPEWNLLAFAIPSSLLYLVIGYIIFKKLEVRVADVA